MEQVFDVNPVVVSAALREASDFVPVGLDFALERCRQ
jgi:hypothetical protein